jgi:hypothetical protein
MKIYVLGYSTGEYADARDHTLHAVLDEETARSTCSAANDIVNQFLDNKPNWGEIPYDDEDDEKYDAACEKWENDLSRALAGVGINCHVAHYDYIVYFFYRESELRK